MSLIRSDAATGDVSDVRSVNDVCDVHSDGVAPNLINEELIAFPILFRRQVQQTPDRIAVVHESRVLTYRELDDMVNRYASALQRSGIRRHECVGLCLDRSPEAIAAMLGVLACGAAFVPLDPEYPVDRLAFMIDDAKIGTIITLPHYRRLLESGLEDDTAIEWFDSATDIASGSFQPVAIEPDDMAYIMYTSGSTGKPKGVQIDHRALATYCYADIDVYKVVADDRTLQFSTLNFDIAIEEIFPPLLTGSAIVVRPLGRSDQTNELSDIIKTYDVTAIHLATAYWHQWVDLMVASGDKVPESIRLMIVTGEKVSVEHYRQWQRICGHEVLWCNAYGPTEATVSATVFIPDDSFDAANMPIGRPLKRYEGYILDADLQEIGEGETGQLFIGGPALARGYLNRPDLTEAAFVTTTLSDGKSRRLYRTGDLARWLPNGDIDFGGRIDHQIKLGSYRIEPGEIEAALDQHPKVMESLVSYDEIDNQKYLIAYVAIGNREVDAADLASFLRDHLPPYMIPARYVFVDQFPKTINGKIDRKALPHARTGKVARDAGYVAPRNQMERKLSALFGNVLNVPEVGIHDDFFLMGGSSLLVTQVVAKLTQQMDIELPVRDFFANPTVASSAKHIQSLLDGDESGKARDAAEADDEDVKARRERLPVIHAEFIPSGDARLFSVRYAPKVQSRDHAVLLCNTWGHEYARAYRNLQQFAIQLYDAGFDVMRFDFAGTGNSAGDITESDLEDCVATFQRNIIDAADHLRSASGASKLSLVGVRMGATLAANARVENVSNLVLWDPMIDGSQFLTLLEGLHDYALSSWTRYNCQRQRSEINQLYGHRFTNAQVQSFGSLQFPRSAVPHSAGSTIVATNGYSESEPGFEQLGQDWAIDQVDDNIYWHRVEFTESAFSSPETMKRMLEILKQESR